MTGQSTPQPWGSHCESSASQLRDTVRCCKEPAQVGKGFLQWQLHYEFQA